MRAGRGAAASARPRALLIDAGNTRIKWALLRDGSLGRQRAAEHAGRVPRELLATLRGSAGLRVVAASVAGRPLDALLARAVRRCGGTIEFVRSVRHAGAVVNGYREPWRLGVDRWVAAIGAHHLHTPARAACVVDVGTAMTVDVVDAAGRHHGGAIVPGPGLMVSSLLAGTSGIRRRAAGGTAARRSLFARDTRSAIERGAEHAAAALIERAARAAQELAGAPVALVLTGGAAPRLQRLLAVPHEHVPDLVLRGLAVLAARPSP